MGGGIFLGREGLRLPKEGSIRVIPPGDHSTVKYRAWVTPLVAVWLIIGAVTTFRMILPPVLAFLGLVIGPRRYMERILDSV